MYIISFTYHFEMVKNFEFVQLGQRIPLNVKRVFEQLKGDYLLKDEPYVWIDFPFLSRKKVVKQSLENTFKCM